MDLYAHLTEDEACVVEDAKRILVDCRARVDAFAASRDVLAPASTGAPHLPHQNLLRNGPVIEPLVTSTTYARDIEHELPMSARTGKRLCYSRPDSVNVEACEAFICELETRARENAVWISPTSTSASSKHSVAECCVVSSGMAAVHAVLEGVMGAAKEGECVVAPKRGYFAVRARIQQWCEIRRVRLVEYEPDGEGVQYDALGLVARESKGQTSLDSSRKSKPVTSLSVVMEDLRLHNITAALVWVESPANPTWDVVDLRTVVECRDKYGHGVVCVDSTVLTPCCTQPLSFGCDLVMHSATKYLNGHSDVLGGALVTRDRSAKYWSRILSERQMGGAVMGSFDAYLLLRGLRTFDLRVTKQSLTAAWLAAAVESKLDSFDVLYPGLLSHPQHHIAKAMCPQGLYGGMVSVVLRVNWLRAHYKKNNKGDVTLSNIVEFCKFVATHSPGYTCATSLGGFETLIEHRYSVECPGEKNPHIPAGLLRISVGLESRMALYDGLKKGVISAMEHFGLDTTLEQPL